MKRNEKIPSYKITDLGPDAGRSNDVEFYRLEDFISNTDRITAPHRHDHFALFLITAGTGWQVIDFNRYEIRPARLFLVAPGQVHAWGDIEGVKGYAVLFTREFFTLTLQYRELRAYLFSNIVYQHAFLDPDPERFSRLNNVFINIENEYQHLRKYSDHIIRSYVNIILFEVIRVYEKLTPPANEDATYIKLREFEDLVNQNFRNMHSVAEYAAQLHITANHLNAICRKQKDKSAGE
ncbi:MAG TPA: AraC family ligand binding domain-containing protein, partial [Chitinophagales bacterium]|nr:AraC family ligand binding domain-containing protein [Chitinophagales bacterium]